MVVLIYIFFISVGTWTKWPTTTDFYAELAKAFDHGQVSLLTKPDPSILALQNPYQYDELRKKATYLWDVSLFNGKYYIYWGPAPAVIMAIVGLFHPIKAGDQYVVFASACGLFFANILLLFGLWKRFFSDLPVWAFEIIIVFVGLVSPLLWSLNDPEIYEASILFGQFLLLSGFYFAFLFFRPARILHMEIISRRNLLGCGNRLAHHVDSSHCILDCAIHSLHDQRQTKATFGNLCL